MKNLRKILAKEGLVKKAHVRPREVERYLGKVVTELNNIIDDYNEADEDSEWYRLNLDTERLEDAVAKLWEAKGSL